MRVGSLFAGIGGFDLAAEALGWRTAWVSEIDPAAAFWLQQHFPDAPNLGDVTQVDWAAVEPVDVLCGGFPCQPHSVAGKREASADDRDLWSECVRAIGVLRPRYAVLENVPGLLTSESGRFFNRVISDLAALGYVGRYDVLSAAECGAPHKRDRVWIVAYAGGERPRNAQADAPTSERRVARPEQSRDRGEHRPRAHGGVLDDANRGRCEQRDAHDGAAAEPCAGLASVGDAGESGRQGRESESPRGRARSRATVGALRDPWSDAIPYRGADGTVRLIPAGAVADCGHAGASRARRDTQSDGAEYASGVDGDELRRRQEEISRPEPALRALVDGIPDNVAGRHAAEENTEVQEIQSWPTVTVADSGISDGTPRPSREATGRTTEYLARTVTQWATPRAGEAKQGPSSTEKHRLSGKDWMLSDEAHDFAAEEAQPWPTCTRADGVGARNRTSGRQHGSKHHDGVTLNDALYEWPSGGSLWPVTDSEPGRVARLKAIGNAIVPAFALYGPFRYILELEHGKEYADEKLRAVR